jgi:hypothetical protein
MIPLKDEKLQNILEKNRREFVLSFRERDSIQPASDPKSIWPEQVQSEVALKDCSLIV